MYTIAVLGLMLLSIMLWDAFEVIILPRRVTHRFRFSRAFYRSSWRLWSSVARWITDDNRRETYLSIFGPLSLLMLLTVWAAGLIAGFAMIHWGLETPLNVSLGIPPLSTYLYMSGTTFFTLGLGDVTPLGPLGRALVTIEAGTGFGFLAAVISYLPILSQAFSRREVSISLLDARAGSPPTAGELLRRHGNDMRELEQLLYDWERWSAELLESHLSYPVLAYFRSQHTNQSWLAALTAILDACALIIAGVNDGPRRQAQLTFAMARHAVADLAQIFARSWQPVLAPDRLPPSSLTALRNMLGEAGITPENDGAAEHKLQELRHMYEPHVQRLSAYLLMSLPPWFPPTATPDTWQITAWERFSPSPRPRSTRWKTLMNTVSWAVRQAATLTNKETRR
jgi:Ion channel